MNLKFEIFKEFLIFISGIRYFVAHDHKTINTEIEEIFQGAKS